MLEMKDSEIPWIGEIPIDWHIMPFSSVVKQVRTGLNPRDNFQLSKEDLLFYVTIRNYKDGRLYLDDNCDRISQEAWAIIQERSDLQIGDILFASISKDAQCYIVDSFPSNWNINESVFSLRGNFDKVNVRFLYYSLINPEYYNELRLDATGTTFQSIKQNKLKHSRFPIPSIKEQCRIVNFLDTKCAEIDSILENTRASVEEYKKLRQSVITEAVTKGVRGKRPMKDSGVDWIGEIPAGWEYNRLKFLFTLHRGYDLANDLFIEEGGIPVYGSGGFMGYHDMIKAKGPNIVIGRSGSTGKLHFVVSDFWPHNTGIYVSDFKGNNEKYVYYLLSALDMAALSTQTAVPTLDRKKIQESFSVFTLDIDEQQEIAAYLDSKCAAIDALISSKEALVAELETYKKSLIYEYVTGKKEVPAV